MVRLTYTGSTSGESKIDDESLEYKWFSADEIKTLTTDESDIHFKELIDKVL